MLSARPFTPRARPFAPLDLDTPLPSLYPATALPMTGPHPPTIILRAEVMGSSVAYQLGRRRAMPDTEARQAREIPL